MDVLSYQHLPNRLAAYVATVAAMPNPQQLQSHQESQNPAPFTMPLPVDPPPQPAPAPAPALNNLQELPEAH